MEQREACREPAPDRSGRSCDKPKGHDGDHWTYGGDTLKWSEKPVCPQCGWMYVEAEGDICTRCKIGPPGWAMSDAALRELKAATEDRLKAAGGGLTWADLERAALFDPILYRCATRVEQGVPRETALIEAADGSFVDRLDVVAKTGLRQQAVSEYARRPGAAGADARRSGSRPAIVRPGR